MPRPLRFLLGSRRRAVVPERPSGALPRDAEPSLLARAARYDLAPGASGAVELALRPTALPRLARHQLSVITLVAHDALRFTRPAQHPIMLRPRAGA